MQAAVLSLHQLDLSSSAACSPLTLLSGDVWLVPELGCVLDKLHIHLNVRIPICWDQRDEERFQVKDTIQEGIEENF